MRALNLVLIFFSVLSSATSARALEFKLLSEQPVQGSMVVGKLIGKGDASFNNRLLKRTEEGIVVFGVGRDAPKKVVLSLKGEQVESKIEIDVKPRSWKIERVDGLPPSKVNPIGEAVLRRIRQEAKLVREARMFESSKPYFLQDFIWPAKGRVSGVYGSQRVLNGEPKRPHFGLDVANKTGTPVVSPIDGVVKLVHEDMYYSGGTIVIDHGFGITTTYIHLSKVSVKIGDKVSQGDTIGAIGATGRATGPHLDWRLNWFDTRLDPQLLLKGISNL